MDLPICQSCIWKWPKSTFFYSIYWQWDICPGGFVSLHDPLLPWRYMRRASSSLEPRSWARSSTTSSCMSPVSLLSPWTRISPLRASALGIRQCTKCTLERLTVSISASWWSKHEHKSYNRFIFNFVFAFFRVSHDTVKYYWVKRYILQSLVQTTCSLIWMHRDFFLTAAMPVVKVFLMLVARRKASWEPPSRPAMEPDSTVAPPERPINSPLMFFLGSRSENRKRQRLTDSGLYQLW